MKSAWVVAVLVCVVLAGAAMAQPFAWQQLPVGITPRAIGMGLTGTAVADDAAAWYQNPAGLAALNLSCREGKDWANDLQASYVSLGGGPGEDAEDTFVANWSAWVPAKGVGVGAGYANADDWGTLVGAGVGTKIGGTGLSIGVNVVNTEPSFGGFPDETQLNAGVLYQIGQGADKAPIRVGVTVGNLTNEDLYGMSFNAMLVNFGIAWPIMNNLLVAVDLTDLTGALNDWDSDLPGMQVNGGVEYRFGSANEWAIRAGVANIPLEDLSTQFTAGLGYSFGRYRFDAAFLSGQDISGVDDNGEATWTVGAGVVF